MPCNKIKDYTKHHHKWLNTLHHTQQIDQALVLAANEVYHRLLMLNPTYKWDKEEIKIQLSGISESYKIGELNNSILISYLGEPYDLITKHSTISSCLKFYHQERFNFSINHGQINTVLSVCAPVPDGDIQTPKDIGVIKTVYSEPSSYTEVSCDYPSNDRPF